MNRKTTAKNARLLEVAIEFLRREKPATLRAVFYACVSAGVIPNKQSEYKRLGRLLTRARESGILDRRWIVDNVRTILKPNSWSGLGDFGEWTRTLYRRDFWASLPDHIEVFVEKDAVAGTVWPVTHRYELIPLPVKTTDNRAKGFRTARGESAACAEIDALAPTEIRRRVESAIIAHIDPVRWAKLQEVERLERESVRHALASFGPKANPGSLLAGGLA